MSTKLEQLTGVRLSAMPIYCLSCHLKKSFSPCFKKEYVPWLDWNQILKDKNLIFMVQCVIWNLGGRNPPEKKD